ncbi:glycoprotease [Clavulina sp. PMI_390]|nr:glycoprotease [Clavulina sp. PMI_390]
MQNARSCRMYLKAARLISLNSSRNLLPQRRHFTVLAFESSADDTCAAVVTSDKRILSNVVIGQHNEQEEWGGIHPLVAVKSHQKNMPTAVRRALDEASLEMDDIDGIAFTRGPGMRSCLAVGADAAKNIASVLRKPLVGVHHMQAHALTAMLTAKEPPQFPFLTLLVSGGHTMLLLALSPTSFHMLATTGDISIGQAFDKISRELNLSWSVDENSAPIGAGPMLELVASTYDQHSIQSRPTFPTPTPGMLSFSYGGLVSAVQRHIASAGSIETDPGAKAAIAYAFQEAAVLQLEKKIALALRMCQQHGVQVSTLVASGGVASNKFLRNRLEAFLSKNSIRVEYPPISLCTDNAVMIAWASMDRFLKGDTDSYNIDLRPKWPLESLRGADEPHLFAKGP